MQPRCPSCHRAWVPGETRCPFCGAAMGAAPGAGLPGAMVDFPSGISPFQLQWVGADGMPRARPVPTQGLRLGRSPENDIVLNDACVSRRHAVIWFQGGQCYIQDAGSSNGTFVNGQRISTVQALRPGDWVMVGNSVFYLTTTGEGVSASAAVPGAPWEASPAGLPPFPGRLPPHSIPAYQPAGQSASFSAGRGITLAGALAVLLMFFMPWVSCTDPFTGTKVSLSGYQIANLASEAATLPGSRWTDFQLPRQYEGMSPQALWLVPVAGLLVLVLAVFGIFLSRRWQPPLLFAQVLLALGIAGVLIWFYADLGEAREFLTIEVGYWGSWVGVFLVGAGAVVDMARVSSGPGG